MVKKAKKPRKGFTRSQKEWEESIATHIGKVIDNLKAEDVLNLVGAGISAFAGYSAAKTLGADEGVAIGAGMSGIIGYQLAKAPNMIAGASGTAYLASLGLIQLWGPLENIGKAIVDIPGQAVERAKTMPFPFGLGLDWTGEPLHIG